MPRGRACRDDCMCRQDQFGNCRLYHQVIHSSEMRGGVLHGQGLCQVCAQATHQPLVTGIERWRPHV